MTVNAFKPGGGTIEESAIADEAKQEEHQMDASMAPSVPQDHALIISQADSNVDSSRALLSRI